MEWSGVEWSGVEWNGVECIAVQCSAVQWSAVRGRGGERERERKKTKIRESPSECERDEIVQNGRARVSEQHTHNDAGNHTATTTLSDINGKYALQ